MTKKTALSPERKECKTLLAKVKNTTSFAAQAGMHQARVLELRDGIGDEPTAVELTRLRKVSEQKINL